MTFTRIFFTATAFAFMAIGLMGVYLLVMLVYTSFDPMIYPFQEVNDRQGFIYPIICIIMGGLAFTFYRGFRKMERDERAGLKADRNIISVARDNF